MIVDSSGRTFKKLRISLTHECNYACVYCANGEKTNQPQTNPLQEETFVKNVLPTNDLIEIVRKLHGVLQLNAVRLTGGEPLLHPRIRTFVAGIHDLGIDNIGMTSNGHLLQSKAVILRNAGLKSVNISLDALSPETFNQMSRYSGLSKVLKSIDVSMEAGLKVKLNTVVISGQNQHEILPLLEFAMNKGIIIRFLELMAMGPLHKSQKTLFFSSAQILNIIRSRYAIEALSQENSSTSRYWSIHGKPAFGIIANDSSPFCSDCNRLRLDSYGNVYGCLSSLIPVPVAPSMSNVALNRALKEAISHKQPSHFLGNLRTMQSIGG